MVLGIIAALIGISRYLTLAGMKWGRTSRNRPHPSRTISLIEYSMNIFYRWAEAVRCSHCALVGIASLATHSTAKIDRLPKGFKAVGTVNGGKIYCVACDRPARTLPIDP